MCIFKLVLQLDKIAILDNFVCYNLGICFLIRFK